MRARRAREAQATRAAQQFTNGRLRRMKGITRRQQQVLDYIAEYIERQNFSPSVRDIAVRFNLVSAAGVHKHIKELVKKGFLEKVDLLSRTLRIVDRGGPRGRIPVAERLELPLAGYVAAGEPIEAIAQVHESVAVPVSLLGSGAGHYVLKVRGSSMIDDNIQDGDYVILEPRETAENGEMVVALINGQDATLKRFYRENGTVRLQPANPDMEPIIIDNAEVRIQGAVVGIWRDYR